MYAPINQIQSPDDEDEDQTKERHDVVRDSKNKHSYYNHNFGQPQDFACFEQNPLKISYERLIQEGFDLASPKIKVKKRKTEDVDDVGGGGGGGRVVRATGRKDRHSKVRTARGPRDRRVRLSPRTAIQFYDVQDRLGYDRPSKAIDWLINEAKTAIDALDEQPNAEEIQNHGGFSLSGMREKQEHLKLNDDSLVSGFSCFLDEAAPPSAAAYIDQDFQHGFCSDLNSNWEMARLQRMFTWNWENENSGGGGGGGGVEYSSGYSLPLHAAAQPISGHVNLFSQREPLQSSVINNDFAGFNFSNELSKIAASATPSATAHYQD